ncbi:GGDEF domain-containing protein [Shewanella sp. GXUN23E]|uniref:GGDEF domain-containing protein n=1 Tax=Shewanella sp. GXUN23E TaxID=3422498 RepID=UPI003D7EED4D
MRSFIQRHGRTNIVIYITLLAVITSDLLSLLLFWASDSSRSLLIPTFISTMVPLIVTPAVSWHLVGLLIKVDRLEQEMRRQACTDYLTRLTNRRAFFNKAPVLLQTSECVCLILLDIDKFKAINDNYGHPTGDQVLIQFANTLKANLPAGALAARMGGEEFVILLANTRAEQAKDLCTSLHNAIAARTVVFDKRQLSYTVSMGLTEAFAAVNIDRLLQQADKALYQAKANGRNRTEIFQPDDAPD